MTDSLKILLSILFSALVYHVPQFLEKFGSLSKFNCQPVEKKNHEQSRMFHHGTQKGGRQSKYTVQVMEKENRKLFTRVHNLYRIKRGYMYTKKSTEDRGSLSLLATMTTKKKDRGNFRCILCILRVLR